RGGISSRSRADPMTTVESLRWFYPELALTNAILAVILIDLVTTGRAGRRATEWPGTLALVGAGAALVLTLGLPFLGVQGLLAESPPTSLFAGMIVLDGFSLFFKVL